MTHRRTLVAALASLPLLGGMMQAQASANTSTPSTAIISCVGIVTGNVRFVSNTWSCVPFVEKVVLLDQVGPAGPQGPAGPVGLTGAQGPAGVQGPAGAKGTTGAQGPAGPAGATCAQGPAGATGPIGATGAQGAQGQAGPAGATGPQGPSGPVGVAIPQGPAGATGANGGQVWSANLNVPGNVSGSGALVGQAAGLGSYTGYSNGAIQQLELPVPSFCTISNFTAVQNGASGTSTAQIQLLGFGAFQNGNPVVPASCTLAANNGGTSSCTVPAGGFVGTGAALVVSLTSNSNLGDFANARIQTTFVCN